MLRVGLQWCFMICMVSWLAITPVMASTWCGQNGVVVLSFTAGVDLVSTHSAVPDSNNFTIVDLYAVMNDVDPVQRNGEAFISIGGFELKLVMEGAKGIIQAQDFDFRQINTGGEAGICQVGILPGLALQGGRATLVHWQILFPGQPRNVVFRLDPDGLRSCATMNGCAEARPYCLYTGTATANQVGDMFGTGYVPAYLNWEGDPDQPDQPEQSEQPEHPEHPDLNPVMGRDHWSEVGIYSAR